MIELDYKPNKGFGNSSMVLCWLNSAVELLLETPLPEFICGITKSLYYTLYTSIYFNLKLIKNRNG